VVAVAPEDHAIGGARLGMMMDLTEALYENPAIGTLDPGARRLALRELAISRGVSDLDVATRLADRIDGYGPLAPLVDDRSITDILINGPDGVWIERDGSLEQTPIRFDDVDHLTGFVQRMLGDQGVAVDALHPIADARMRDGSRVHAVLPPAAPDGPLVSIRRFPRAVWTLEDLAKRGALMAVEVQQLADLVRRRTTVAISGGTGSGKTTLLNALLSRVDGGERVVGIEETRELRPRCEHFVSLLSRPDNMEGRGGISPAELMRAALRMRPDRIVVGEVRGAEALVALQAMSTGHPGSMVTLHANSPGDARRRMTSMALQASSGLSEGALQDLVERSFGAVIQLARVGGTRRVVSIEET